MKTICISIFILLETSLSAQNKIDSFRMNEDVKITINQPLHSDKRETVIILFALPNGNSTEQTMGKKMKDGDDWHFDIQHIRAQTTFIREKLPQQNFIVVYLEN